MKINLEFGDKCKAFSYNRHGEESNEIVIVICLWECDDEDLEEPSVLYETVKEEGKHKDYQRNNLILIKE